MNTRILCILGVFGLAALSPAPIKDIQSKYHELPVQSEAQVTQEQRFNGVIGQVGSVPLKTNDNGTAVQNSAADPNAEATVAAVEPSSDPNAVKVLTQADKDLKAEKANGGWPAWATALGVFGVGFLGFQGFRYWLEKFGPAPS